MSSPSRALDASKIRSVGLLAVSTRASSRTKLGSSSTSRTVSGERASRFIAARRSSREIGFTR